VHGLLHVASCAEQPVHAALACADITASILQSNEHICELFLVLIKQYLLSLDYIVMHDETSRNFSGEHHLVSKHPCGHLMSEPLSRQPCCQPSQPYGQPSEQSSE
jgi:hypothetical protein